MEKETILRTVQDALDLLASDQIPPEKVRIDFVDKPYRREARINGEVTTATLSEVRGHAAKFPTWAARTQLEGIGAKLSEEGNNRIHVTAGYSKARILIWGRGCLDYPPVPVSRFVERYAEIVREGLPVNPRPTERK